MPFVNWDESFETGIKQFDAHHQHLVGLLNKAYDDFICAAPDENLGFIIYELIDYTIYHFTAEEDEMQKHSYPNLVEHKQEHDSFVQRVSGLKDAFDKGNRHLSLEVLTYLKIWLKHHILESDAEIGRFLSVKATGM
ncbi:MAG: hemerythrin family protein [Geobacteraceae bacterium]|nr:hemerythrin family protein [Geobacteraceae bacterium]NTW79807.1 hemerythrin family protein [Geobacteraceae bacterium]